MSHVLTEAATFDPTVTVPDGTDSGAVRAANVTAISQVLANRSRYLKLLADGAAQKSGGNTFTGTNTFGAVNTAALTATSLTVTPGATSLADLTATSLTVTGATDLHSLTADTGVVSGELSAGDFLYAAPKAERRIIGASAGANVTSAPSNYNAYLDVSSEVRFNGTFGGVWEIPFAVPNGAHRTKIWVFGHQPAGQVALTFSLYLRSYSFSSGAVAQTVLVDLTSFDVEGDLAAALWTGDAFCPADSATMHLVVSGAAASSSLFRAMAVDYTDFGPSSHP
jgi:hypothetical protein